MDSCWTIKVARGDVRGVACLQAPDGRLVGVMAQQYVVLVEGVPDPATQMECVMLIPPPPPPPPPHGGSVSCCLVALVLDSGTTHTACPLLGLVEMLRFEDHAALHRPHSLSTARASSEFKVLGPCRLAPPTTFDSATSPVGMAPDPLDLTANVHSVHRSGFRFTRLGQVLQKATRRRANKNRSTSPPPVPKSGKVCLPLFAGNMTLVDPRLVLPLLHMPRAQHEHQTEQQRSTDLARYGALHNWRRIQQVVK